MEEIWKNIGNYLYVTSFYIFGLMLKYPPWYNLIYIKNSRGKGNELLPRSIAMEIMDTIPFNDKQLFIEEFEVDGFGEI